MKTILFLFSVIVIVSCDNGPKPHDIKYQEAREKLVDSELKLHDQRLRERERTSHQNSSLPYQQQQTRSSNQSNNYQINSDGEYEAEVEYYNPNTRRRSTYTLPVDVENGEVVKIYWPNGGWTDESHFSGAELDDNGEASFRSDQGYTYTVTVSGYNNNSDEDVESEDDLSSEFI